MTLLDINTIKENYLIFIKNEWLSTSNLFPDFMSAISNETKLQNEHYIQNVFHNFQRQIKSYPRTPIGRNKWKQATENMLMDVLYNEMVLDIHQSIPKQSLDALQEELKDFLRQLRSFAPEISFSEIGQALRNYIVYIMFKEINQLSTGFSSACFGYSMLYPFTDNYIDSKKYSNKQKAEYNQIIRDKIVGKEIHPDSIHQQKTCDLLQMIESKYPRNDNPMIYSLLLNMLDAQENSMRQQNSGSLLTADERLDISLYKGCISVLIDRYFVDKEITEEDMIFYNGFGFFLQIVDDLQDIKEDSIQGNQTIFTVDLHSDNIEKITNKMLHFVHQIMQTYQAENDKVKNFILFSCYQLIFSSIVGSKEFFSKEYLDKTESYYIVTYPYLEKVRGNQITNIDFKNQTKYMKILDGMLK
ncbi:MAG: hypothetical protein K0R15_1870 [Clostridiales bacterium]|jgi:hypothetical protein|nr:hypothetical protein [Clostridiales bacterium]